MLPWTLRRWGSAYLSREGRRLSSRDRTRHGPPGGARRTPRAALAERKGGDEVQLHQVLHVVDAKVVDGEMGRMPPGVVDDAIDAAVRVDGLVDDVLQLGRDLGGTQVWGFH